MNDETNTRHAEKMKKIKAARDRMMAGKTAEKGLILVHTAIIMKIKSIIQ